MTIKFLEVLYTTLLIKIISNKYYIMIDVIDTRIVHQLLFMKIYLQSKKIPVRQSISYS